MLRPSYPALNVSEAEKTLERAPYAKGGGGSTLEIRAEDIVVEESVVRPMLQPPPAGAGAGAGVEGGLVGGGGVGREEELERRLGGRPPWRCQQSAGGADVLGLGGRKGGEVVRPNERRRTPLERSALDPVRPVKYSPPLQRGASPPAQDAVHVRPAGRIPAGVEAVRRRVARQRRNVLRQERVEGGDARRRTRVARHLSERMNACVRPTGHGEGYGSVAQHDLERPFDLLLYRPAPGLPGPAAEVRAVVFEQQPALQPRRYTSSSSTISVWSERRGPSFMIRA